jgi:lipopolysaccharide biosynthesis glycosyltransferase
MYGVATVKEEESPATHVVLLCDENIEQGLFATINSIVANCATPRDLHFHIGLESSRIRECAEELDALFGDKVRAMDVVDVHSVPGIVPWYRRVSAMLGAKRTSNLMNYARFFVADMFPSLASDPRNTYVFLDVDKIVYGDMRAHDLELRAKYDASDRDGQFLAVGLDESRTVFRSLGLQSWRDRVRFLIFCKRHGLDHFRMYPFNAGYYVATIGVFCGITERVERLVRLGLLDICQFNTQPLMMCALWDRTHAERWNWNVVNYGWKRDLSIDRNAMGSIHWNGPSKGWDRDNEYHWAYSEYAVSDDAKSVAVAAKRGRDERAVLVVVAAAKRLSEDVGFVAAAPDAVVTAMESAVEAADHHAFDVAAVC